MVGGAALRTRVTHGGSANHPAHIRPAFPSLAGSRSSGRWYARTAMLRLIPFQRVLHALALAAGLVASVSQKAAAEESRGGEQIFKELCAKCHGATGQGNEEHETGPLSGDRSLAELTELIDKTMPEGEPEKCVGEDAKAVAAYIYDAFYSPIAQARNQPARIELSRLTVRQYQNAVTDLIGSFRGASNVGRASGA